MFQIVYIDTMNLRTFDLNLLRVLDALLTEQSTVKAASRVGLSQSAVSAALGRLRGALDDPLFVRHGQRIVPTDFARSLELPLKTILDDLERLLLQAEDFDPSAVRQSFKIAASDFFAVMLMPQLAAILASRAPQMQVQLVDLLPASYAGILEQPGIDLALVPKIDFPPWSAHQVLFQSRFVMIARDSHPRLERSGVQSGAVVPMDLFCDLGHVVFSPEGNLKAMGDAALARLGRARRIVMTLPVFAGVCIAVAGSDLVALVPEQLALRMAPLLGLTVYQTPMPLSAANMCMLWHKRSTGAPAHRWFRSVVAEVAGSLN
jgi:DNA-binding transcriptional LysR family regulator